VIRKQELGTKRSKAVTLDWDNISIVEARDRFHKFVTSTRPIHASLWLSACKGFHVRAEYEEDVDNWRLRRVWRDDPHRLVYEILRIGHDVDHEFLWEGKLIPYSPDGSKLVRFDSELLENWSDDI
jgi:hypothetical protein